MSCDHFFFFQAEDGIRDKLVTGVQTCALPISFFGAIEKGGGAIAWNPGDLPDLIPRLVSSRLLAPADVDTLRSEEHTSELQSLAYLVCRLLLEKKNTRTSNSHCLSHDTRSRHS